MQITFPRLVSVAALLAALVVTATPGWAQEKNPGWFVPHPAERAVVHPALRRPTAPVAAAATGRMPQTPVNVPLPAPPALPPLAKGAPPPGAVIGVLDVPEVMHDSTAAQQVEKLIGQRREKLAEDAQKEQAEWQRMQQALVGERGKLSHAQLQARENALRERITTAQKTFQNRNTVIQQAAQYSLGQIERTLIGVIRQVAESRGMNLVLHRSQVALNVNDFDITQAVAKQLNTVLPLVEVPPDGMSLAAFADKLRAEHKLPPKKAPAEPAAKPGPRVGH